VRSQMKQLVLHMPAGVIAPMRRGVISPLRAYFRYVPWRLGKEWLWRTVAAHLWWLEGTVTAATRSGDMLTIDASDIVGRYIYYFGIWEPNLTEWLRRVLRPGDVFVDVGANIGYFSVLASRLVGPDGLVVAVEPIPELHRQLEQNIAANGIANVRAVCGAAWDAHTSLDMFTREAGPSGTSTAYASWAERWHLVSAATVPAMPLSATLHPREIARARVIKIDAEGAEWRIIRGLYDVLSASRPDLEIVVEVAPKLLEQDHSSPEAIAALLAQHGFHPYRLDNKYEASAYYNGESVRPTRMNAWPEGVEQLDIIFSRSNSSVL